ncbi:uncharacterized protein LOC109599329 [Aethina tumida]|uniref:uncharacterized protein LOC109599329 n=1 Tax=Aethina tumida TaxID=116153 RepID=UPI00096B5880|nr:uncharacterized protein LOC109599329 [Aethina tumida]
MDGPQIGGQDLPVPPRRASNPLLKQTRLDEAAPQDDSTTYPGSKDASPSTSPTSPTPTADRKSSIDEELAKRRRSLVPMSSMEEENLRDRLHLTHLKLCNEIVGQESKYTKESLRRLFQKKASGDGGGGGGVVR